MNDETRRYSGRRRGVIVILSAPSGTGKTTLIKQLLAEFSDLALSVSHTTRGRRAGEVAGSDYHFVTAKAFERTRARGGFAEWARVHGSFYGTPRRFLEQTIRRGKDVLLDIDVQGARKIKAEYREAVSVFLLPPSWGELKRRLAVRGTDRTESIRERLKNARREMREVMRYDYCVVNREIGEAFEALRAIIVAERLRTVRFQRGRGGRGARRPRGKLA